MRVIRPGKIASSIQGPETERKVRSAPEKPSRDIWDDFSGAKKTTKKKEYEPGPGNRMVQRASQNGDGDDSLEGRAAREGSEGIDGSRTYQPRTDFEVLEAKLNYTFKDRSLLARALTHRSALGLRERADYERLEFLGDAVLDLSVAHLLSDRHPDAREGDLSKMRAALVNTQALAEIGKLLEVGPYIRLGRGELSSGGHERPSILADVMEAIIGAIYRDSNFDEALKTIEGIFGTDIEKVTPYDPKTELQEALHAAGSEPPAYLLELVEGPEHAPTFVTVVIVDGEVAGRGRGATKKAAQQAAAAEALERMVPSSPAPTLADGQRVFISSALLVAPTMAAAAAKPDVDTSTQVSN